MPEDEKGLRTMIFDMGIAPSRRGGLFLEIALSRGHASDSGGSITPRLLRPCDGS
jgi:hypothetical protein